MNELLTILLVVRQNRTSNNQITSNKDLERYFAVETARGYIIINREYESIH